MNDKCPTCGQMIQRAISKAHHNIMNHYVNADNPKEVCIMNSDVEKIEVKDKFTEKVTKTWILQSTYSSRPVTDKPIAVNPVLPTAIKK